VDCSEFQKEILHALNIFDPVLDKNLLSLYPAPADYTLEQTVELPITISLSDTTTGRSVTLQTLSTATNFPGVLGDLDLTDYAIDQTVQSGEPFLAVTIKGVLDSSSRLTYTFSLDVAGIAIKDEMF